MSNSPFSGRVDLLDFSWSFWEYISARSLIIWSILEQNMHIFDQKWLEKSLIWQFLYLQSGWGTFTLIWVFNFLHRRLDWHCLDFQNQSLLKNLVVEFSYRHIEMTCGWISRKSDQLTLEQRIGIDPPRPDRPGHDNQPFSVLG